MSDFNKTNSDLWQHGVDITEKEDNSEYAGDADCQAVSAILWTHPEHNPTEHNKEDTREVQLDQVIPQTALQQERRFQRCIVT